MAASGGVLRAKVGGVPLPVIVVGGTVAAYFLYSKWKGAGQSQLGATQGSGSASQGTDAQTAAAVDQIGQQVAQEDQALAQTISSNEQAGFANLLAQIAQMQPAAAPAPAATPPAANSPAPAQPSAASSPGFGTVQTAQGQMIWLGVWGSPHYQVGGGAPVYFGNANSLAQGPQAEVPGADVYTPVAYASLVSSAPS